MDVGRVEGVRHELPQHLQLVVELNSQHLVSDLLLLVDSPVAELWAREARGGALPTQHDSTGSTDDQTTLIKKQKSK